MPYIRTDENNMVVLVHNQPFDPVNGLGESKEELSKTGYFIDSMPEPQSVMGKRAVPYFNPETKEVTYKYIAAPISSHQRLDALEAAFNEMLMSSVLGMEDEEGGDE